MIEIKPKKKKPLFPIWETIKQSDRTFNSLSPLSKDDKSNIPSSSFPIKNKFPNGRKNELLFELGKINLINNNNSTTQKIDSTSSILQSYSDEEKGYIDELTNNTRIPKKLKNILDLSSLSKNIYSKYIFKIKIIDYLLCALSITTIILSFLDNYQIVETYNPLSKKYIIY